MNEMNTACEAKGLTTIAGELRDCEAILGDTLDCLISVSKGIYLADGEAPKFKEAECMTDSVTNIKQKAAVISEVSSRIREMLGL